MGLLHPLVFFSKIEHTFGISFCFVFPSPIPYGLIFVLSIKLAVLNQKLMVIVLGIKIFL